MSDMHGRGRVAAEESPDDLYPPILDSLRRFWMEDFGKASLLDTNAFALLRSVLQAFELEVSGHEALRWLTPERIKKHDLPLKKVIEIYNRAIEHFLNAGQHWGHVAVHLDECEICWAIEVSPESLKLACWQQRSRLCSLAQRAICAQMAAQKAALEPEEQLIVFW